MTDFAGYAPPGGYVPSGVRAVSHLERDAVGVVQGTVVGMASSAPAGTVAATLAGLAATAAYGGGLVLVLTAVPMLVIANAYRKLNLWNANCGASFEWVGRAISPCLGFMTGWVMIAGYLIGTVAEVVVLGPSVLSVLGVTPSGPWPSAGIDTAVLVVMGVIAVAGIRLTARVQIAMAVVEYAILSLQQAPVAEQRTVVAIIAAGMVLMLIARYGLRSAFFAVPREAEPGTSPRTRKKASR